MAKEDVRRPASFCRLTWRRNDARTADLLMAVENEKKKKEKKEKMACARAIRATVSLPGTGRPWK
jgi:hypothetical protein